MREGDIYVVLGCCLKSCEESGKFYQQSGRFCEFRSQQSGRFCRFRSQQSERVFAHGVLLDCDKLATLPKSGVGSTVGTETESL